MARKMKSHTRAGPRQGPGYRRVPLGDAVTGDGGSLPAGGRATGDYEAELEQLQYELFRLQIQQYLAKRRTRGRLRGLGRLGQGREHPPAHRRHGPARRTRCGPSPRPTQRGEGAPLPVALLAARAAAPASSPSSTAAGTAGCWWSAWRASPDTSEWSRAYDEINDFEQQLAADGVRIAKFFLHIDTQEQLQRFQRARVGIR